MSNEITIPYLKKGRKRKRPSLEEFAKNYGTMSILEMAELYNTTPATIRTWASTFRKEQRGE